MNNSSTVFEDKLIEFCAEFDGIAPQVVAKQIMNVFEGDDIAQINYMKGMIVGYFVGDRELTKYINDMSKVDVDFVNKKFLNTMRQVFAQIENENKV